MKITEPEISAGLMTLSGPLDFELRGTFRDDEGGLWPAGGYRAVVAEGALTVSDAAGSRRGPAGRLRLSPMAAGATFLIRGVVIGISFHWQQQQDQEFAGRLNLTPHDSHSLLVINEVPLETYLVSVISSEMSSLSDPELLRAHAIISRSWLLAQISPWRDELTRLAVPALPPCLPDSDERVVRWYDREGHDRFDVCADDHCQRYHGLSRADRPAVGEAVRETRGQVLTFDGRLCDARFSKSCGGITERFSAAWQDFDYPYLQVAFDGEAALPLPRDEAAAESWIRQRPPAFCNTDDPAILRRILPDFDQKTADFYRWKVTLSQNELRALVTARLGFDPGAIRRLEPVERGASGRLIHLRLVGESRSVVVGKELEIRRLLSPSHLYSSAFVVDYGPARHEVPESFTLVGAGWGHGVGLCQIGAAIMAEKGFHFSEILGHYYRGAQIVSLYDDAATTGIIPSGELS